MTKTAAQTATSIRGTSRRKRSRPGRRARGARCTVAANFSPTLLLVVAVRALWRIRTRLQEPGGGSRTSVSSSGGPPQRAVACAIDLASRAAPGSPHWLPLWCSSAVAACHRNRDSGSRDRRRAHDCIRPPADSARGGPDRHAARLDPSHSETFGEAARGRVNSLSRSPRSRSGRMSAMCRGARALRLTRSISRGG
jgi:hypothetical protein